MQGSGRSVCAAEAIVGAALIIGLFMPDSAKAESFVNFQLNFSSERTVQAGSGQPQNKRVLGETSFGLNVNGVETDACFPGDGRPSAAQADGANKVLNQSDDRLVFELSSRSFAQGGHIRKCASCPLPNTCLGISGADTTATATASSAADINVSITSPLKRFQYDLFVGHVDTDGQSSVSVTTADGRLVPEIPNRPSHFLMSESNRDVIVHAEARTKAADKGGCCNQSEGKSSIITVSLKPTAELDVNYVFKPFIAGGKSTTGYPYVVALGLNGRITCSGTYVGAHTVVTAAHCVYPVKDTFKTNKLDVRFGSSFNAPDQKFEVDAVNIPNNSASGYSFNPKTFEDDIAVVSFAGDAAVKPAELYAGEPPWSNIVDKKLPVQIVGFGFNVIDGGMVGLGFKREAAIHVERFENRKLFFGSQSANTCDGDSGGPLFVETPDGKAVLLAGVTSGGDDSCTYGVDTRTRRVRWMDQDADSVSVSVWGAGMRLLGVLGSCMFLGGCAGQILNDTTLLMSPSIGSVEERQVLQNLAKFVNNSWAIPGHVELATGQIQITNQVGVNFKFPYSKVLNGAGAVTSKTIGSEADVNPAQTQDQESYSLLPVTDSDDLRRLRALYHYAVCPGNPRAFALEWGIADQRFFRPVSSSAPAKPPKEKTLSDVIKEDLKKAQKTGAKPEETAGVIRDQIAKSLDAAQLKDIQDAIASKDDIEVKAYKIICVVGPDTKLIKPHAAAGSKPAAGGKSDQTKAAGGSDSTAYEDYKMELILASLGEKPWLFVKKGDGSFSIPCRDPGVGMAAEPPTDYLGSASGLEFWTNDRKKFSDLVLFVLGGIPNTVGSHVLGGAGSKAGAVQSFYINGQPAIITQPKATARP